ncbi:MarR family transcriptional regulator [Planctomonas sp. JC2975]|uniref:MarR family winged helix-turn-helix transcriptional regulator n=1 Tax=Planctomonas sp. JC2975 TaxID=2729626 RepID=UPI001474BC28|nr:MarR family transcriptional regulator [Planctomonas sp. JC2975]NNC12174.1 MarR family transcriptional regulator [Planctomonas sp. JC2975]
MPRPDTRTADADSADVHAAGDRDETAARLAVVVGRINRRIRAVGSHLTQAQLSALSSIARKGPLRPGDLARIESIGAPGITRLVADLEARGLVERHADPDDGRSSLVTATEAGAEAVLRARAERAERVGKLMAELDDDEVDAITGILDTLERVASAVPKPKEF